jgi:hypothetical protein
MKTLVQVHEEAEFLRESSGSNIEKTLLKAVKVLALFQIPHYVCGGFAVQEHGYPRLTVDVDIIVPDVEFAREKLCMNGFNSETKVGIDLLPGATPGNASSDSGSSNHLAKGASGVGVSRVRNALVRLFNHAATGEGLHKLKAYAALEPICERNRSALTQAVSCFS